jgi:hypothetical protein
MRRSRLGFCTPLALALSCAVPCASAEERVALSPQRAPPWRASRVLASLRDGAREPRELRIETAPPGAQLELAYLRAGAQLAHARGAAPLVATLPSHALTAEGDRILVRAELAGYAPHELALDARELSGRVRVELAPLPPRLLAGSLLELGEHSRLELISDRALDARLVRTESGWRLVLADVAASDDLGARLEALRGEAVARVRVRVVGTDWIVELTQASGERRSPRLTRRDETVRSASHLALEWLPEGGEERALARARDALARLDAGDLGGCGAAFEDALAASLGRETLARSLAPSGAFTDAYVALALEALAAASPRAELALRDGSRVASSSLLARASVAARASEVRNLLVAIRALAESLAPPGDAQHTLHAWLAPERTPEDFTASYARAADAEAGCRAPN